MFALSKFYPDFSQTLSKWNLNKIRIELQHKYVLPKNLDKIETANPKNEKS